MTDAANATSTMAKAELLAAVRSGRRDDRVIRALADFATGPLSRTVEDAELMLAHAESVWIAEQRNPESTRARDAAAQLVRLLPTLRDGYKYLGLAHLSRGEPALAARAFAEGETAEGDYSFAHFLRLAERLVRGERESRFSVDGATYVMPLSTHNAAAIEAGAFHAGGMLTEIDELRTLNRFAGPHAIKRIVEVGVLVGNHTAYFLQTFRPEHLVLIDADPANLPLIERVVAANTPAGMAPIVETVTAFVGRGGGDTRFAGATIPHRRLSELVTGPLDLIKIDVDGAEATLLSHGGEPIVSHRPVVMIEVMPATDALVRQWFAANGYGPPQVFGHGGYANLIYGRPTP